MPNESDPAALIRRFCRDSDQGAFNQFYRQQSSRLWRFLRSRGCHEEAAYDLVAESFERFIQSVCKDPASPLAFLYRIATNLHIDQYRRETASPLQLDNERIDLTAADKDFSADSDQQQLLRHYLGQLPKNEQNLLLLRYWIGLTHKEIARVIELPEGTVRRQAAAALKKLRDMWMSDEQVE